MLTTSALSVSRDGRRRYYSRQLRLVHVALILFMTTVLALGPTSEFAYDDPQLFRRACLFVVAVGLSAAWRVLRRGAVATPERVVVRNLLWSRVIPTTNIERFDPAAHYGLHFGTGGLAVRTLRGRDVHAGVFVTTPADGGGGGVGQTEAKELNEWLAAVRTGVPFPPGSLVPAWTAYGGFWVRGAWVALLLGLLTFMVFVIVPALLDPSSLLG